MGLLTFVLLNFRTFFFSVSKNVLPRDLEILFFSKDTLNSINDFLLTVFSKVVVLTLDLGTITLDPAPFYPFLYKYHTFSLFTDSEIYLMIIQDLN